MKEAAAIFLKWWDAQALIYERYGAVADVEEKPEWPEVLELQRGWLSQLEEQTGSDQELLFEKTQIAINKVLGIMNDVAVSLSLEQASKIIETTVDLVLAAEAKQALASGRVN